MPSAGDLPRTHVQGDRDGTLGGAALSLKQWLYLTVLFPRAIKHLIMKPNAAVALQELRKAHHSLKQQGVSPPSINVGGNGHENVYNLTGKTAHELGTFITRTPDFSGLGLHVSYNPTSDHYRVELHRSSNGHGKTPASSQDLVGAWRLTSISGKPEVPELILAYKQDVFDGARVLFVPDEAPIASPLLVPLSTAKGNGGSVTDFWVPRAARPKTRGSSAALLLNKDLRERFQVGDLLATIRSYAKKAREKGKEPAIVSDLDGTVFDAREFVWILSNEWLQTYDGPDAGMIRDAVAKRGKIYTWNINSLLADLGFSKERHLRAHESAAAFFEKTFRSPEKRLGAPPIKGMVKLMRMIQDEGIKTVYVTLRSEKDDQLPNGESSSVTQLKNLGIFNEKSVLLRHTGEEIDWSVDAYKKGKNEPEKWMMVKKFRKENPHIWFVAVAENAPAHVMGYRAFFKCSVVNIHVQGDNPPNSPELPDGVFTVNPDQLHIDLLQLEQIAQQEQEVNQWDSGEAAAMKLFSLLNSAKTHLTSEFRYDYKDRIEGMIRNHAKSAAAILDEITSLAKDEPKRFGFVEALHRLCVRSGNEIPMLEVLEDMINIVNAYTGSSFGTIRGPAGLIDVVRTNNGGNPTTFRLSPPPATFENSALTPLSGVEIRQLPEILSLMPQGPAIVDRTGPKWHNNLTLGRYPRMEFALRTIVGALAQASGKDPHRIRTIEYGPRIAIGALVALARMDTAVCWKDILATNALHTSREVMRLPEKLRARIVELNHNRRFNADLAIWNLPLPSAVDFTTMGREVVENGYLVTQTDMDFGIDDTRGWQRLALVPLNTGEYVMPSAFLCAANGPLTFQVWQRTAL